jgi:HEAT repeat protein
MQKMVSEVDEAGINPVYFLTRALVTGDEDTRGAIIGILGKIEDESSTVVAALVQMIDSVNIYRSHLTNEKAAIALIEKIGGEQAVDALADLLGNNLKINEVVAESLGNLGDVRAVESLISVLSSDSKAVARALGTLGDARAVGPLIGILGVIFDSYKRPYYYGQKDISVATEALVMLGDKKAIEPLVKGLDIVPRGRWKSIIDAISSLLEGLEIDAKEMDNLRRFLIGEDAGMRGMGLSMLKGILTDS